MPASNSKLSSTPKPTKKPSNKWSPCSDAGYQSRLRVGNKGNASFDPPYLNNVRAAAGNKKLVGQIDPGENIIIIAGPDCANGWVWWRISSQENNLTGWTSEGDKNDYWLVPK